jgi:hypothetical protein
LRPFPQLNASPHRNIRRGKQEKWSWIWLRPSEPGLKDHDIVKVFKCAVKTKWSIVDELWGSSWKIRRTLRLEEESSHRRNAIPFGTRSEKVPAWFVPVEVLRMETDPSRIHWSPDTFATAWCLLWSGAEQICRQFLSSQAAQTAILLQRPRQLAPRQDNGRSEVTREVGHLF